MLASYGEQIGPWVIGGMTMVILYRWYWGGKLAPDPWERTPDSDLEDENE